MAILFKFFILIVGSGLGVVVMLHNYQLTQLFGHNYYAEKYLGSGGTYTFWKLLGVLIIIAAFWYLFT